MLIYQLRNLTIGFCKPRVALLLTKLTWLFWHCDKYFRQFFILLRYLGIAFIDIFYNVFYTKLSKLYFFKCWDDFCKNACSPSEYLSSFYPKSKDNSPSIFRMWFNVFGFDVVSQAFLNDYKSLSWEYERKT